MKRLFNIALIAALLPVINACALSLNSLEPNAALPSAKDGIYVIGVKNDRSRIDLYPGSIKNGAFEFAGIDRIVAYMGPATNGYVVAKTRADDTLGLRAVNLDMADGANRLASACGGVSAMTFKVPGGKITYVGDIEVFERNSRIAVRYSTDFKKAQRAIATLYPQFASVLEDGGYQEAAFRQSCTQIVYR